MIGSSLNYMVQTIILKEKSDQKAEQQFNYQMLGRLKTDCDYYLGNGYRCKSRLWADDEKEQIEEMKKRWNSLPEDKKPVWLTYDKILEYEKEMII